MNQILQRLAPAVGTAALLAAAAPAPAAVVDTAPWGRVLERHQRDGGLDYAALAAAPADLEEFLAAVAAARLEGAGGDERTAFWINAYNAVVARFVLDAYPGLDSVQEVDGFFDQRRQQVAGESLTLDEIEDRALAGGDERVHFAVVCASQGCPGLRPEPFSGERLDRQLEEQTRAFLADPDKGLRFDRADGTLWLSSIFKWYADDFTGRSRVIDYFARGRVLDWVIGQVPAELAAELAQRRPAVRYLDYDWSLNDRPAEGG